jgi:hypothetical protein
MTENTAKITAWSGELLWPQPLPEGDLIDLGQVTALGTWAYAWFRARPPQAVTGVNPALKRQLSRAGVPVRWSDAPQAPAAEGGVTASERAMLWGEP